MPFGYYKVSVHRYFTIFANCKFKEVHQMSMSIKRSRLFKLLAVAALAMVMAIGTALPSFASSDDKVFFFSTEENYAKEAFISPALIKENTTSIYCWIQNSSNSKVSSVKMNARGGGGKKPNGQWSYCNSSMSNGRVMQVGTSYFIYNNVKEAGYNYATLSFTASKVSVFRGVWSPDSVYQSGVAQI